MGSINKDSFDLLCKEYGYNDLIGLVFSIPECGDITCRERIEVILNSPIYGDITCFPEEENVLAIAEFLDFLRSVGNEIKLKGDIQNPRYGEIQNAERKYIFNNGFLKDRLLSFLSDLLQEEEIGRKIYNVYPEESLQGTIRILKEKTDNKKSIPKGAEEGAKFWRVYNILWGAGIFYQKEQLQQKELCFIYDCALLAGCSISNTGEGFKGLTGREKATLIRNRIKAYQDYCKKED